MENQHYYSVIQFVPNSLRDERINIGIIVQKETLENYWLFPKSFGKYTTICNLYNNDISDLVDGLIRLFKNSDTDLDFLKNKVETHTCFRLTPKRLTVTDDIEKELYNLYSDFVY